MRRCPENLKFDIHKGLASVQGAQAAIHWRCLNSNSERGGTSSPSRAETTQAIDAADPPCRLEGESRIAKGTSSLSTWKDEKGATEAGTGLSSGAVTADTSGTNGRVPSDLTETTTGSST